MLLDLSVLPKRTLTAMYAEMESTARLMDTFFTDTTSNYISPAEPNIGEIITITMKTSRRPKSIKIVIDDVLEEMEYDCFDEHGYHVYKFKHRLTTEKLEYYFAIHARSNRHYAYNRRGLCSHNDQTFNFKVFAGFKTPQWAKGAVMYQIYVDRFYNGDKSNDVLTNEYKYLGKPVQRLEWDQVVTADDYRNFYGGDLQGVIDKLDYIQELGVDAIYFNPIFVAPSNHKYDAQDYDYIDPHIGVIVEDSGDILEFGKMKNDYATKYVARTTNKKNLEASNQLFIKLVELAHERNIKVIIDGVFNHCGAFNKWLDTEGFYEQSGYPEGAYISEDSPYHDYFVWTGDEWPNNDNYSSWWGHKNHPKLNFEGSPELVDYIMSVAKKWVSPPFNCDGWRLDVAADLGLSPEYNHEFWKKFRKSVKSANSEAVIISEHYGDPSSWLKGDEWDTIMNYDAFMEPLTWFLTGVDKHSETRNDDLYNNIYALKEAMSHNVAKLTAPAMFVSMNQLSNHDHSRFLTRTNRSTGRLHTVGKAAADNNTNMAVMFEAIVLQLTWIGAPTLYYGDEIGMKGWTDPDNRRTFEWDNIDYNILNFYKECIRIHKENEALKIGSTRPLKLEDGVITFGRWTENNSIITAINNLDREAVISVSTHHLSKIGDGVFETLLQSFSDASFTTETDKIVAKNNMLELTLPPKGTVILRLV